MTPEAVVEKEMQRIKNLLHDDDQEIIEAYHTIQVSKRLGEIQRWQWWKDHGGFILSLTGMISIAAVLMFGLNSCLTNEELNRKYNYSILATEEAKADCIGQIDQVQNQCIECLKEKVQP